MLTQLLHQAPSGSLATFIFYREEIKCFEDIAYNQSNSWSALSNDGINITVNSDMAYDDPNNIIYAITGNRNFRQYNGSWIGRAAVPNNIGAGGSLTYSNNFIYAIRGGNTSTLYRYSIAANT